MTAENYGWDKQWDNNFRANVAARKLLTLREACGPAPKQVKRKPTTKPVNRKAKRG